jgi:hypothetical protein
MKLGDSPCLVDAVPIDFELFHPLSPQFDTYEKFETLQLLHWRGFSEKLLSCGILTIFRTYLLKV